MPLPNWKFYDANPLSAFRDAIAVYREHGYTWPNEGFEWHLSPRMAEWLATNEPGFGGVGTILMGIPVTKIESLPDDALFLLVYEDMSYGK